MLIDIFEQFSRGNKKKVTTKKEKDSVSFFMKKNTYLELYNGQVE